LINEDGFIDQTSEYRIFSDQSDDRADPRRCGNAVNVHLDSQIDLINIDDGTNKRKSYGAYSLQSNTDKLYLRALKLIKRYCQLLDLHDRVPQVAEEIFLVVQDKKEIKGKRLETLIGAVLYLACRKNKVNITAAAFEGITDSDTKRILKACKIIYKFIPPILVPSCEYVRQFGVKLELPRDLIRDMEQVCREIEKWDIFDSHSPQQRTVAGAVILFFFNIK
jgi:transcription initiation factor TFIIIB Brf1 subunit/transcription initiation factor TFIIB